MQSGQRRLGLQFTVRKFAVGIAIVTSLFSFGIAAGEPWMGHLQIKDSQIWRDGRPGNYGSIHYFLDESVGETIPFEVTIEVYADGSPGSALHVEVFTNLNRRDYAKIFENPADADRSDSYYKAIPMIHIGKAPNGTNELYRASLTAQRTGAYRLTTRFRMGSGPWLWHNDFKGGNRLQRDCAIVISPRKTLDLRIYEVNPLVIEATPGGDEQHRSTFEDFTDHDQDGFNPFSLEHVRNQLNFNTIWLMPIFPNTNVRLDDHSGTLVPNYSPGSPYAARDYWSVNPRLSRVGTAEAALKEFQYLVKRAEDLGLNIFIDVALNHAGRDVVYGQGGVDLGFAASAHEEIRQGRPSWGTHKQDYRRHADSEAQLAPYAPADRMGEHRWLDAGMDWYFGDYSSLGPKHGPGRDTSKGSAEDERDLFYTDLDPTGEHDVEVEKLWQYFSYLFPYWLSLTDNRLDGIRADFAQGLPPQAWEYIINKTRQKKWDFIFLAEALDPDPVRYRANRHFDLLTALDHCFYRSDHCGHQPVTMSRLVNSLEAEVKSFGFNAAVLFNGTSHDERDNGSAWLMMNRYAVVAALYGVPMVYMSQPLGIPHKVDFEKSWQSIKAEWVSADPKVFTMYNRINSAREHNPALRFTNRHFLQRKNGGFNENIFSMARWTQDNVILVFANLREQIVGTEVFEVPRDVPLRNAAGVRYHAYNLLAEDPNASLWPVARTAEDLVKNGITVQFSLPNEAQYIALRPVP